MKNFYSKILILFLFLALSAPAFSQTLSREEIEAQIIEQIKVLTQKQIEPLGGGEIEVKILNMPQGDITTKNKALIKVESNTNGFLSRDLKRVSIYDGETFVKSFPISVNTLVYKDVLCAINPITREQNISRSNTAIKRAQIGEYIGQTIDTNPKSALVASRNIPKGSPVLKSYVKSKPDVLKDSTINIVFESMGNLRITIDGKALKEGSIGDNILVKSSKYNKVYRAVVSNKNEATVKI